MRNEGPPANGAEPLLLQVLKGGKLIRTLPSLEVIRARCSDQLRQLPSEVRQLDSDLQLEVGRSERLEELRRKLANGDSV